MRAYERFLQYVQVDTQSDPFSTTTPSTEKQKNLARALVEEMTRMGMTNVRMDDTCYVYGEIPATVEGKPTLGLIAHMDTTPDMCGTNVKPRIVEQYDGGVIPLGDSGETLDPARFPHLLQYVGQDLIVTGGTTLLGADDKAGVAEILTAAETILAENRPHGRIVVGFTPDEEIGRGADLFDVPAFGADFAYTVDGGQIGELEYENFNGAAALVTIHGVNIHPGEAKDKMKNACLIAMEFHRMVPPAQAPAHACGYEGFYHLAHMEGSEELACLRYIIRDHDKDKFRQKKEQFERIARYLNETCGVEDAGEEPRARAPAGGGQGRHGGLRRHPPGDPHPGRHRRGQSVLQGPALPQPVHRRPQCPQPPRVYPRPVDGQGRPGPAGDHSSILPVITIYFNTERGLLFHDHLPRRHGRHPHPHHRRDHDL